MVFTKFRGPDVAGIVEHDNSCLAPGSETLNSMGNWDTIPPYSLGENEYPLGRLLVGCASYVDQRFLEMLERQGQQSLVTIDTSWLSVGHVDEIFSFVKSTNPRGWSVLASAPMEAWHLLQRWQAQEYGSRSMFYGMYYPPDVPGGVPVPAVITIDEVLGYSQLEDDNVDAQVHVDVAKAALAAATGVAVSEFVDVKFLFGDKGIGLLVAFQPGMVNGVYLADGVFAAPNPHGPAIGEFGQQGYLEDGMKEELRAVLSGLGVAVEWVEDWDIYHVKDGEVHCGSNVLRAVPDTKWWEVEE